jgi:A/G-specific adenine glycosylase
MKGVSPGAFNQAIMNFGALVCKPANPACTKCPLSQKCFALQNGMVTTLPARSKKKAVVFRHFHFVVITWRDKILLQRRDTKDIWQGLYTPPMMERKTTRAPSLKQLESFVENIAGLSGIEVLQSSPAQQQLLSHQTIVGRFHFIRLLSPPHALEDAYVWVTKKSIDNYARPKMIAHMPMHV